MHDSVPISNNEDNNALERDWTPEGVKVEKRDCLSHHEVLTRLDGYDPDRGVKIVGHRGYCLTGYGLFLNLALINYGDYTWNSLEYDATKSMKAAIEKLAGSKKSVREALVAFVDLNQNWPYREPEINAPELSKDVRTFWQSRRCKSRPGKHHQGDRPLRERLNLLAKLPETLSQMDEKKFALDVAPWTAATVSSGWTRRPIASSFWYDSRVYSCPDSDPSTRTEDLSRVVSRLDAFLSSATCSWYVSAHPPVFHS